jgi:hypothetical protein
MSSDMIKRVGPNKYVVMTHDGKKKLSKPMSHGAAVKRLAQVEFFKTHHSGTGGY